MPAVLATSLTRFPRILEPHIVTVQRFLGCLPLLAVLACGGGESPTQASPDPQTPVATTIQLSTPTLEIDSLGATQQLTAAVLDQSGSAMPSASVSWSTTDGSVASVSTSGLVTAEWNGSVSVTARSGSLSASATVQVSDPGWISFTSNRDGNTEVYVMRADGSSMVNVTQNGASDSEASWSADGSRIVFVSTRDGINRREIYVMNFDGSDQTRLTDDFTSEDAPVFSPDGSRILFLRENALWVMDADGQNQVELTGGGFGEGMGHWSPDGSQIVYGVYLSPDKADLLLMNADGSDPTNLTNGDSVDQNPRWSPDGERIVFESNRDGCDKIYAMNADGSGQTLLTPVTCGAKTPDWSPDGLRVVYHTAGASGDIYVIDADGSNQKALVMDASIDGGARWALRR